MEAPLYTCHSHMYHHQPLLEAQYCIMQDCCSTTAGHFRCSRKKTHTPHFFYLQKKKKSFCEAVNPWGKREKPVARVSQALLSRSCIFQHRPFKIHLCSFVVSVLCNAGIRKLLFTSRHKPD